MMEEEMFWFRSVFARETRGESALRGVCVTGIWALRSVLIDEGGREGLELPKYQRGKHWSYLDRKLDRNDIQWLTNTIKCHDDTFRGLEKIRSHYRNTAWSFCWRVGDEQFRSDEDAMKTRVRSVKKRKLGENTHAQRRINNLEWRGSKSGSKTYVEDMKVWDYMSQFGRQKVALFEREEEIVVEK